VRAKCRVIRALPSNLSAYPPEGAANNRVHPANLGGACLRVNPLRLAGGSRNDAKGLGVVAILVPACTFYLSLVAGNKKMSVVVTSKMARACKQP